jgi:hypothetical protein
MLKTVDQFQPATHYYYKTAVFMIWLASWINPERD